MAGPKWMEPTPMTAQPQIRESVQTWMSAVKENGGIERYDDLHIDQINPVWKNRSLWIEGALEAFRTAINVRTDLNQPVTVVVAFSLQASHLPLGVNFSSSAELKGLLDWSPPSLYLFYPGQELWDRLGAECTLHDVDLTKLLGDSTLGNGHLVEFKSSISEEYYRTLFLASAPL